MQAARSLASSSIASFVVVTLASAYAACRSSEEGQGSDAGNLPDRLSGPTLDAGSTTSVGSAEPSPTSPESGTYPCPPGEVVFEAPRGRLCAKPCRVSADCSPEETCITDAIAVARGGFVTNFVGYCAASAREEGEPD